MEPNKQAQEIIAAAESGSPEAQYKYAEMLRTADEVELDLEQSRIWYKIAADQGHSYAQNDYGSMLLNGLGGPKDGQEATRWYLKAAEGGCADAQFNMAQRYIHGDFVELDGEQALFWAGKAAQNGHVEAATIVGTCFRLGNGIPKDIALAARFHIVGASNGDPVAHGNLADYRDEIEELALSGNRYAALATATLHAEGLGGEPDRPRGKAWLELLDTLSGRALDADDDDDKQRLTEWLDHKLTPAEQASAQNILSELEQRASAPVRQQRSTG